MLLCTVLYLCLLPNFHVLLHIKIGVLSACIWIVIILVFVWIVGSICFAEV